MSGSVSKCLRGSGDEGLPLILQLLEDEISTGPVPQEEASHSRTVSNGVAMLLGNWPGYLTSACVSAAAITVLTTIMIVTPIVTITMLHNNMRSEMEIGREPEIPGIETHRHYQKEQDKMTYKGTKAFDYDIFNLTELQNISSFEVARKNISAPVVPTPAQQNVFFVTTTDSLSTCHLCAVESAAKIASNYNIYTIMLSIDNTKPNIKSHKRFERLSNLYPNIKLFRSEGDKYFHDSPLRGILQQNNIPLSLVQSAARILTLWRYGGITYDPNLITLDNTSRRSYPVPSGDNVMISTDGGNVMSVRSQCQAFLYDMMTSVTLLYAKHHEIYDLSNNDVIKYTVKNVCYNASRAPKPDTLLQEEPYKNCKGVTDMPHHMICRRAEERKTGNSDCVWALCNGKNPYVRKHLCPVSYREHTLKEAYTFKVTRAHKLRHKHFH
jgi:hypothetical protein